MASYTRGNRKAMARGDDGVSKIAFCDCITNLKLKKNINSFYYLINSNEIMQFAIVVKALWQLILKLTRKRQTLNFQVLFVILMRLKDCSYS